MHKIFYVSGFLYHLPSQQILLLESDNTDQVLFTTKSEKEETPQDTFKRAVTQALRLQIHQKFIHSVYDYFHNSLGGHHFIVYGELTQPIEKLNLPKTAKIRWSTFKQISKLDLSEQAKQDIIVGQRVINLAERKSQEEELGQETSQ